MRYNSTINDYESVPLSTIRLNDEVLVYDPIDHMTRREKIVYLHDHAKEPGSHKKIATAIELTVTFDTRQ